MSIAYSCRDCIDMTPDTPTFTHADGCPHDAAFESVCAQDRAWFIRHPNAAGYWRPVTWPEIQDLRSAGILPVDVPGVLTAYTGRVYVYLVEPPNIGIRARAFHDVELICSPA